MENREKIIPEAMKDNPFQMIGKDWMLVTAQKPDGSVNTMTASWGGMGVMWGKNVCFVVIRPQRYTKEFIDSSGQFSLSFLNESYRSALNYCGTISGREEDKIQKSGLHTAQEEGIPYICEAEKVILCQVLYQQEFRPECFQDEAEIAKWYPKEDYHTLYIAEIKNMFQNQ